MQITTPTSVRHVVIVSKPHLDIGFTESAAKVTHDNINWELFVALDQSRQLRERGGAERFVWTVPAWIIHAALERHRGESLRKLEQAIADGDLAWHALPFTTHSELMDPALFTFALSLSRTLDQRFGKETIAAKLTDVPGHTRGIVPLLAEAGVRFLHVGVNHMSAVPDVPPVFRWRDRESGRDVVVAYERGYGGIVALPGADTVLAHRMVGDNMEVPSIPDILAWHAELRAAYPGAEVAYGTLSDFARALPAPAVAALPVVEAEIGDTWIHGVGTDPWKVARYRELLRLRREWLADGRLLPLSRPCTGFSTQLALVAEHTWGISIGAWIHDLQNMAKLDFQRVRHRSAFRYAESSWLEQRDYLELAVDELRGTGLEADAAAALAALQPAKPDLRGWSPFDAAMQTAETGALAARLDARTGAIRGLRDVRSGRELVAAGGTLGLFRYQTFSAEDSDRYARQYCGAQAETGLAAGFGRPGLRPEHSESRWWNPVLVAAWTRPTSVGIEVLAELTFDSIALTRYGAPAQSFLTFTLHADQPVVHAGLTWFGKTASRLPEALWFGFQPAVNDPSLWRLRKMGRWVSPLEVVSRGARNLHAIEDALRHDDGRARLTIESPDAPLVSPGAPALMTFDDALPDLAGGMHFPLWNNQWTTNFPQWYEDDALFRVTLRWE